MNSPPYTDSNNSEDEGLEDYKIDGYHTVHVGEILLDRYVSIATGIISAFAFFAITTNPFFKSAISGEPSTIFGNLLNSSFIPSKITCLYL